MDLDFWGCSNCLVYNLDTRPCFAFTPHLKSSAFLAVFDFMSSKTTIAVIFGYFRLNGLLKYNIKYDDIVNIIKKFLIEKNIIKIDIHGECINAFDHNYAGNWFGDVVNKTFAVIGTNSSMLSNILI